MAKRESPSSSGLGIYWGAGVRKMPDTEPEIPTVNEIMSTLNEDGALATATLLDRLGSYTNFDDVIRYCTNLSNAVRTALTSDDTPPKTAEEEEKEEKSLWLYVAILNMKRAARTDDKGKLSAALIFFGIEMGILCQVLDPDFNNAMRRVAGQDQGGDGRASLSAYLQEYAKNQIIERWNNDTEKEISESLMWKLTAVDIQVLIRTKKNNRSSGSEPSLPGSSIELVLYEKIKWSTVRGWFPKEKRKAMFSIPDYAVRIGKTSDKLRERDADILKAAITNANSIIKPHSIDIEPKRPK